MKENNTIQEFNSFLQLPSKQKISKRQQLMPVESPLLQSEVIRVDKLINEEVTEIEEVFRCTHVFPKNQTLYRYHRTTPWHHPTPLSYLITLSYEAQQVISKSLNLTHG
jgi:hypothetical protein